MAEQHRTDPGGTSPDVDDLVAGIRALLNAARTLREMGATEVTAMPPRLVQVCREVLDEVDAHRPLAGGVPDRIDAASRSAVTTAVRDVPLRRLLLQVITPGETFTVPDIVDRLAGLGKQVDSAKVSNALGYQVDRGQLVRERKGLYTYPVEAASSLNARTTARGEESATRADRISTPDRRQLGGDHDRRTVVREQEVRRGHSAAQKRREAG